ncbi:Protein-export membrane protein SecG [Neochlamydia sp. EPS4]|uniref:preprotein translocase subunit SecG n=1 Tax=Neochlamydia sp. EPS4 TaxID=1478175 RepID=UPI000583DE5B|nr:preprotein translocase subunit SecG [Neochlamydia sp. EPS4]KIC74190.1 Protein-export membrane protein SecG [Neochlamydia sp. EPS4]
MTFLYYTTMVFFMILCALLCFVILIQESKSSGLGASFGGEASESLFGTSTADVLKKFTAWLAVIFFAACIILSLWTNAIGRVNQAQSMPFTLENTESS